MRVSYCKSEIGQLSLNDLGRRIHASCRPFTLPGLHHPAIEAGNDAQLKLL
jgi:hypothetical protein